MEKLKAKLEISAYDRCGTTFKKCIKKKNFSLVNV